MAIVVWLVLLEGLYLHALRTLRGRGVAVPPWQVVAWHAAMALWIAGLLSPIDSLADDGLSMHMAQHLLIADLAAPLMLVGLRNPVLAFFLPRSVLVPLARTALAARRLPLPAQAAGGAAGLRAGALRLALLDLLRGRGPPPARARAPARVVHRHRRARVVVGARAQAAAAARRAVEDRPHPHRALPRHVPGDVLRAHPRADLHRRLRDRRAHVRAQPDRAISSWRAG